MRFMLAPTCSKIGLTFWKAPLVFMMIGIKPKIDDSAITAALVRPKVTRKIG